MASNYEKQFTNRMVANQTFDVYDILKAFDVPCHKVGHAIKKLLAAGQRNGGKSELQDLEEAKWSIEEAIEEIDVTTTEQKIEILKNKIEKLEEKMKRKGE